LKSGNESEVNISRALPRLIFECANAHGGDINLLKSTLQVFEGIEYPRKHLKYQAFHYDTIALPDYEGYQVYTKLVFAPDDWAELIAQASNEFEGVWLDIFDVYGVDILKSNSEKVYGIKLQASVLDNGEVLTTLKSVDLSAKVLMLNISGYPLPEIARIVERFAMLTPAEMILQIGHQAYPTPLEDTGLQKISTLRAAFPKLELCLADHAPATDPMAGIIPLLGLAAGCSVIEKHICLERATAKYDHFSALEPAEMQALADNMKASVSALSGPFISKSEEDYLAGSIQVPVAARPLVAGSLVAMTDVHFRRAAQKGDSMPVLLEAQQRRQILADNIAKDTTITAGNFRPASIGVIVAARMKSSRLKRKALLPLAGRPSIERCLESCLSLKSDIVVLATSTVEEDSVLERYTMGGRVKFWRGHPEDVIARYVGACDRFGIDVVLRVTGDCPILFPEIAKVLLARHFEVGADYTSARDCAPGTDVEVFNAEVLRRVLQMIGTAEHSEYMTWYMRNNAEIFKVEIVDLPVDMVRDYRLTLDYAEDLEMFSRLYGELAAQGKEPTLANVFAILDTYPEIAKINAHCQLTFKVDRDLIAKLDRLTKITAT